MDLTEVLKEIGGGLPAVVICGLAYAYWRERERVSTTYNHMIEREREHSKEMTETILTIRDAVRVLETRQ